MQVDSIILKIIESSIFAGILILVLWAFFVKFLPRLTKSIDETTERNSKEHAALTLMLLTVERRMNWHEAKVYGVNPSTGTDQNMQQKAATEAFIRAEGAYKRLNRDIHELFDIPNGHNRSQ